MMWLYVVLVALVVAALPTVVWLKRAGDAEWQAHRIRVRIGPMTKALIDFQVALVDQMTPGLRRIGAEMNRMQTELRTIDPRFLDRARQLHFDPKDRA